MIHYQQDAMGKASALAIFFVIVVQMGKYCNTTSNSMDVGCDSIAWRVGMDIEGVTNYLHWVETPRVLSHQNQINCKKIYNTSLHYGRRGGT